MIPRTLLTTFLSIKIDTYSGTASDRHKDLTTVQPVQLQPEPTPLIPVRYGDQVSDVNHVTPIDDKQQPLWNIQSDEDKVTGSETVFFPVGSTSSEAC